MTDVHGCIPARGPLLLQTVHLQWRCRDGAMPRWRDYCGQPAQNVDGIWHYFDYTHVFKGEQMEGGMEGGFTITGKGRNKGVRNAGPACAFCGGFKRAGDPFKWVYDLHTRGVPLQPHVLQPHHAQGRGGRRGRGGRGGLKRGDLATKLTWVSYAFTRVTTTKPERLLWW